MEGENKSTITAKSTEYQQAVPLEETSTKVDMLQRLGEQADRLFKERVKDTKTIKSLSAYATEELIAAGSSDAIPKVV